MNLSLFNRGSRGQGTDPSAARQAAETSVAIAARLQQECAQLTTQFRTPAEFGYDPDEHRWWIRLGEVALPENMSKSHVPVIILVSGNYPVEGPTDVFLPRTLGIKNGWGVVDIIGAGGEETVKGEWARCAVPGIAWRQADDLCRLLETLVAVLAVAQKASVTLSIERIVDNRDGTRLSTTEGDVK